MNRPATDRIIRHRLFNRVMHWVMAASILVLLFTGLLPQFDFNFAWVTPHWIAGLILPGYESWWDVSIAEVSEVEAVQRARKDYEEAKQKERYFI